MLSPQRYERLHQLFTAVCELQAAERAAFLDRECADDPSLREKVQALLAKDADTGPFMEQPALGEDFELEADGRGRHDLDERATTRGIAEGPGTTIGPYKILQLIGEGGFGAVYMAEQEKPLRRRVALKIIKLGMDTKQVIARFEVERQALAMMDHPNIAKVFDAGATASGGPYFVMELVKGVPLTEYCDDNKLTMRQRIDLFMPVCHALQHAHQKGIIHRDVKPSNVMVTLHDGSPVPKVIDFGIAKATNARLTEKTMFTAFHQLIGTPAYMSPEQAEMSGLDVDTRSDIYSLGVLLYELLTGTTPFDPNHLRSVPYDEIQRIIREEEPEKPSTRISSLARPSTDGASKDATSWIQQIAKHRQDDPVHLMKSLRGDLDWIVMKCLEKDRTRRYETANGLALDIQRYLNHEPVLAGPPSRAYRLRKFVRRNRAGVAAGSVVAISLIVAAGVSVGFALSEAQQRRIAAAEATRADEAALKATEEKDIAQAVNEFLNDDLLAAVAPSAERGKGIDVLMRDVLDEAAKRIEEASGVGGRFQDKALVEASIRLTLGETYRKLGEYSAAEPHLERARELRRHVLGEEHPDTLKSMNNLAALYYLQGRYEQAEPLFVETLGIQKRVLGEEHPATLGSMHNLANLYRYQGRYDEAEPLNVETLEIRKRVLGEEHPATLSSMNSLANLYWHQARYDEAEPLYLETLGIQKRVLGEEHPDTLMSADNLAMIYGAQGRYDEAEPLNLEALEIFKRVLGAEHPDTLLTMNSLANLYLHQGRYEEAEPLNLEALEIFKRVLGAEHPDTLLSMNSLANLYRRQGRYDEAEPLFLETLELQKRVLGEEHPHTLANMNGLANLYRSQGRYDEAEPLLLQRLEIQKRGRGEEHPETLGSMFELAILYKDQDRYDEAEPLYLETLEIRKRVLGDEHPATLGSMYTLANLYDGQGRYDEAEPLYLETLGIQKRVLGDEHPDTLWSMNDLALSYRQQGRYDEAEPLNLETLEIRKRVLGDEHPDTLGSMNNLAILYYYQARYDEAEPLYLETLEIRKRVLGEVHPKTLGSMNNLAVLYAKQGRTDKARPLVRELLDLVRKRAERPGASANEKNMCAWELLTCEPADLRDPEAALPLALEANEMTGHKDPSYLDTLSLAYQLTGDTAKAIENQKQAIALLPPGESSLRTSLEGALADFESALKEFPKLPTPQEAVAKD